LVKNLKNLGFLKIHNYSPDLNRV